MAPVSIMATEYHVSALEEDDYEGAHLIWGCYVAYRGDGKWAVCRGRTPDSCLSIDGEWDYEPLPSNRTEEWIATHRFTKEEALKRAIEVAPTIVVNNMTAADVIAMRKEKAVAQSV